jgi:Spy/CpxP family protein refolding chaperone
MIAKRFVLAATIIAALPLTARGQTPPAAAQRHPSAPPPPHAAMPSFDHLLFPPELVMQHQRALELTAEQRSVITDAVKSLQNQTVDLQWNLQAEQATLADMLDRRPINEQAVVAQVSKLLELEANVKRTHLSALVRIKNALTDKQIQQLTDLRGRNATPHARDEFFEYIGREHEHVDTLYQHLDVAHQHISPARKH